MRLIQKYSVLVILFLLCGSHSLTSAGIRPSFELEGNAWNATHIVIATEGKTIDGIFRVLESWKGDLNPGDTIKIPELASFKPASSRTVSDPWYQKPGSSQGLIVTGDRMVLFLKKDFNESVSEGGHNGFPSPAKIQWKSPSSYKEMSVSVVWIEQGKAYGFVQVMNPGPSLLISLGQSEDELKNRQVEIKDVQDSLLQTAAITDPARRAEALASYVHHSLYDARGAAFEALGRTGTPALPVLRRMLADDSLLNIHDQVIDVLSEVGKGDVGPDLTSVVERGLEFWRLTGPGLKKGWWNGQGFDSWEDAVPLRDRYSEVYRALLALRERPYRESEKVVTQFRDFWRSLPQLEEIGSDQMTQACDDLLRELDRLKADVSAIRFEGLHALNESDLLRELREQRVLTLGSPLPPEKVEQAQTTIKELMASQGYTHATVAVRNDQSDPTLKTLTFVISEGEPIGIAKIRFAGNKVFSSAELIARMWKCLAGDEADPVNIYNAEEIDYCLRGLDNFARSKGYLRARFHDPEIEESKNGLVITVHADEDTLYRLGEIAIEGAGAIPTDRMRAMLSLRSGDAANGEMIGKWLYEDLKKQYGEMGYVEYTAEADPEFRSANGIDDGTVNFKVTIEEGRQFRVHAIKFQGSSLSEKDLLGLLRIHPGDVFNSRLWEESIDELNTLGRFASIDKDRDADFTTDQKLGLIDIVIKLRPAERSVNE
jgi:outer membrane translocation and assembly module TamA